MSIIQLPTSELKPALVGLGKIISKRVTLPILGMVKVDRTKDGWITLSGTNLDQFVTVRLEQPTDGAPESVLVSYEDLNKTLKVAGKSNSLDIESKSDNQAVIRYSIGNQAVETPVDGLPIESFQHSRNSKLTRLPSLMVYENRCIMRWLALARMKRATS